MSKAQVIVGDKFSGIMICKIVSFCVGVHTTRVQSTRFGCRSCHVCSPTIWNKLTQDLWSTDIRELFKGSLKRWLFECVYGLRQEARLIDVDWRCTIRMDLLTYLLTWYFTHLPCLPLLFCVWLMSDFILLPPPTRARLSRGQWGHLPPADNLDRPQKILKEKWEKIVFH